MALRIIQSMRIALFDYASDVGYEMDLVAEL